jgi:enoyl-CoA hydratase
VSYAHIRVEVAEGLASLTFSRPEAKNALHLPMNLEIRAALEDLASRSDVGALVLTGAGEEAFMSGADIAELKARRGVVALARHNAKLCDAIEGFPFPTIAAIRGYALGGGCEVALACDLRVAGRGSKLGQPEVGLGILPAAGGTWRLPRIVGLARAKELIYTGRILDAEEALEIGLVNRVVEDDRVVAEAEALGRTILKQSRLAVRLAKAAIDQGRESSLATASMLEALAQHALYDDPEKEARMARFLERKRPPDPGFGGPGGKRGKP